MNTKKDNKPLKVLVVSHDFPPYSYSGAPLFALFLSTELEKSGVEISFFYPRILLKNNKENLHKNYQLLEKSFNNIPVYELILFEESIDIFNSPYFWYENKSIEDIFKKLLEKEKFNFVHYHSIFRLSSGLPQITKILNIPSCITLHDFWFLCHRTLMADYKGNTCAGPDSIAKCAKCFNSGYNKSRANKILDRLEQKCQQSKIRLLYSLIFKPIKEVLTKLTRRRLSHETKLFFEKRLENTKKAYKAIDYVISPSKYLAGFYKTFGFDYPKIIPHGLIPVKEFVKNKDKNKNTIVFGFAGQIIHRKGIDLFIEAVENLKNNNWRLLIFGNHQNDEYFLKLKKKMTVIKTSSLKAHMFLKNCRKSCHSSI